MAYESIKYRSDIDVDMGTGHTNYVCRSRITVLWWETGMLNTADLNECLHPPSALPVPHLDTKNCTKYSSGKYMFAIIWCDNIFRWRTFAVAVAAESTVCGLLPLQPMSIDVDLLCALAGLPYKRQTTGRVYDIVRTRVRWVWRGKWRAWAGGSVYRTPLVKGLFVIRRITAIFLTIPCPSIIFYFVGVGYQIYPLRVSKFDLGR